MFCKLLTIVLATTYATHTFAQAKNQSKTTPKIQQNAQEKALADTDPTPPPPKETGWINLFNGKDLTGWHNSNGSPDTWSVKQLEDGPVIHCTGKPICVLHTSKHYENFILEIEWRHLKPRGNAGIFVWSDPVTAKGQPFTRGIEVQVLDGPGGSWYTTHGDIFPIHGARLTPDNPKGGSRSYPTEHRSKPSPQWNKYRIVCNNGVISLSVNGQVVTTGLNASPRKGYICLESESSPAQFKNIRLRELPPSPNRPTPNETANYATGYKIQYNGTDFRGLQSPAIKNWQSSDWTFTYDGKATPDTAALSTTSKFKSFDMILDYRLQTNDQSPATIELKPGLTIEIPGPDQKIKLKQWQRLEISLHKNRLAVFLNGRFLRYYTPNLSSNEPAPITLKPRVRIDFANFYVK